VGITNEVAWEQNSQWLDVLAKSGTPLFVSIAQDAYHDHVKEAVTRAFETASSVAAVSRPLDWMETRTPHVWQSSCGTDTYEW
jgi:alpha-galactosidase